jgi:hypothetical protein
MFGPQQEAVSRAACVKVGPRDRPGWVDAPGHRGCRARRIHGDEGAVGSPQEAVKRDPVKSATSPN